MVPLVLQLKLRNIIFLRTLKEVSRNCHGFCKKFSRNFQGIFEERVTEIEKNGQGRGDRKLVSRNFRGRGDSKMQKALTLVL